MLAKYAVGVAVTGFGSLIISVIAGQLFPAPAQSIPMSSYIVGMMGFFFMGIIIALGICQEYK